MGISLRSDIDFRNNDMSFTFIEDNSGIDLKYNILLEQVHGVDVAICDGSSKTGRTLFRRSDAVVFDHQATGYSAGIRVADCMPVFVCASGKLVAAFHSGWRGLAGGMVSMLADRISCNKDITFYVGPHICSSCYRISPDLFAQFHPEAITNGYLNLYSELKFQIRDSSFTDYDVKLLKKQDYCTYENPAYNSYRKGEENRMLVFAIQY